MFSVKIDEKIIDELLESAIKDKVDEIAKYKYFLTYDQLASYLNISKPVIEDRLIKNGLNYYKVGTKYLFKINEVDQFLDEMTNSMTIRNNDIKFFNGLVKDKSER